MVFIGRWPKIAREIQIDWPIKNRQERIVQSIQFPQLNQNSKYWKKKSIEMFQIELMLGIGIRHGIGYKRRTLGPIPISRFFSAANQNEWNGIAHCHWSWFYGCKTTANQRPRRKWIARNCHSNSSPFVYPFVIDVRLCYLQWINSIRNSLSSCL